MAEAFLLIAIVAAFVAAVGVFHLLDLRGINGWESLVAGLAVAVTVVAVAIAAGVWIEVTQ